MLPHIYSAMTFMPTEFLQVNYAHIYYSLREYFPLFTFNTYTTRITLQLCKCTVKYCT